jgi:hypothetical protein
MRVLHAAVTSIALFGVVALVGMSPPPWLETSATSAQAAPEQADGHDWSKTPTRSVPADPFAPPGMEPAARPERQPGQSHRQPAMTTGDTQRMVGDLNEAVQGYEQEAAEERQEARERRRARQRQEAGAERQAEQEQQQAEAERKRDAERSSRAAGRSSAMTGMAAEIAQCESGGDPNAQNPHSSASGLYQFIDSTWERASGLPAPASAYSPATQTRVFWKVWDGGAGASNWNPSRHCWGG